MTANETRSNIQTLIGSGVATESVKTINNVKLKTLSFTGEGEHYRYSQDSKTISKKIEETNK